MMDSNTDDLGKGPIIIQKKQRTICEEVHEEHQITNSQWDELSVSEDLADYQKFETQNRKK